MATVESNSREQGIIDLWFKKRKNELSIDIAIQTQYRHRQKDLHLSYHFVFPLLENRGFE